MHTTRKTLGRSKAQSNTTCKSRFDSASKRLSNWWPSRLSIHSPLSCAHAANEGSADAGDEPVASPSSQMASLSGISFSSQPRKKQSQPPPAQQQRTNHQSQTRSASAPLTPSDHSGVAPSNSPAKQVAVSNKGPQLAKEPKLQGDTSSNDHGVGQHGAVTGQNVPSSSVGQATSKNIRAVKLRRQRIAVRDAMAQGAAEQEVLEEVLGEMLDELSMLDDLSRSHRKRRRRRQFDADEQEGAGGHEPADEAETRGSSMRSRAQPQQDGAASHSTAGRKGKDATLRRQDGGNRPSQDAEDYEKQTRRQGTSLQPGMTKKRDITVARDATNKRDSSNKDVPKGKPPTSQAQRQQHQGAQSTPHHAKGASVSSGEPLAGSSGKGGVKYRAVSLSALLAKAFPEPDSAPSGRDAASKGGEAGETAERVASMDNLDWHTAVPRVVNSMPKRDGLLRSFSVKPCSPGCECGAGMDGWCSFEVKINFMPVLRMYEYSAAWLGSAGIGEGLTSMTFPGGYEVFVVENLAYAEEAVKRLRSSMQDSVLGIDLELGLHAGGPPAMLALAGSRKALLLRSCRWRDRQTEFPASVVNLLMDRSLALVGCGLTTSKLRHLRAALPGKPRVFDVQDICRWYGFASLALPDLMQEVLGVPAKLVPCSDASAASWELSVLSASQLRTATLSTLGAALLYRQLRLTHSSPFRCPWCTQLLSEPDNSQRICCEHGTCTASFTSLAEYRAHLKSTGHHGQTYVAVPCTYCGRRTFLTSFMLQDREALAELGRTALAPLTFAMDQPDVFDASKAASPKAAGTRRVQVELFAGMFVKTAQKDSPVDVNQPLPGAELLRTPEPASPQLPGPRRVQVDLSGGVFGALTSAASSELAAVAAVVETSLVADELVGTEQTPSSAERRVQVDLGSSVLFASSRPQ